MLNRSGSYIVTNTFAAEGVQGRAVMDECKRSWEYATKYAMGWMAIEIFHEPLKKAILSMGSSFVVGGDVEFIFRATTEGNVFRSLVVKAVISKSGISPKKNEFSEQEKSILGYAEVWMQEARTSLGAHSWTDPLTKDPRRG
jgi:hypothetical protein